jgi:hypothetical protein
LAKIPDEFNISINFKIMSADLTDAEYYWRGKISRIRINIEKLQAAIDEKKKAECFEVIQVIDSTLAALRSSLRENMDGPTDQRNLKRRKDDR